MFHLIFITIAVLFCVGFGIWCFNQPDRMALGVGTLVAAVALAAYEVIFVKKTKNT
jgi:hypothetical protein